MFPLSRSATPACYRRHGGCGHKVLDLVVRLKAINHRLEAQDRGTFEINQRAGRVMQNGLI